MDRLAQLTSKEFNFQIALTTLLLALVSFSSFVFVQFTSGSNLVKLVSLVSFVVCISLLFFNKNLLHLILRPVACFLLNTYWKIEVEGAENIPEEGEVLLAGNHTGLIDSLIVSVASKRPVGFLMTNEVFTWPVVGKIAGFFNVIPVVQGKGMNALNKAIGRLKEGKVVCIFPEGICTEDGNLNRFHRGVARMQTKSKAPLVPFCIKGGMEAWKIGGRPQRAKIIIQIGQPVYCNGLKEKEITDNLKETVQCMLDSIVKREKVREEKEYHAQVLSLIEAKSNEHAESKALTINENGEWEDMTYSELTRQSKKLAGQLLEKGLRRSDRVAILSESRPEWAVAFFAGIRAGATIVPLDIKLAVDELKSILTDSEPTVLFVSNRFVEKANELKAIVPDIKQVYVIEKESKDNNIASIYNLDYFGYGVHKSREFNETALIVYTSGTTGNPKGVMISFKNLISQINELENSFSVEPGETFLSMLPLNHMLELTCGLLGVLNAGGTIVYSSKLTPSYMLKTMQEKEINYMITVPLFLKMFKRSIEKEISSQSVLKRTLTETFFIIAENTSNQSLKKVLFNSIHRQFGGHLKGFISGGAPLDLEVAEFFNTIGLPVYQGYGLTETSPIISLNTPQNNKLGSVGKVLSSVNAKISENGELMVQGPNVMQGYHKQEDLTKEVISHGGWFHTGDIARIDEDGYLYITGRIKNLIVLGGGKKVLPEEVETVLSKNASIKELCVLGLKQKNGFKKGTEEVHVVIVPDKEVINKYNSCINDIEKYFKKEIDKMSVRLASYKRPTALTVILEELPKTATKKIKRKELMQLIQNKNPIPDAA